MIESEGKKDPSSNHWHSTVALALPNLKILISLKHALLNSVKVDTPLSLSFYTGITARYPLVYSDL